MFFFFYLSVLAKTNLSSVWPFCEGGGKIIAFFFSFSLFCFTCMWEMDG